MTTEIGTLVGGQLLFANIGNTIGFGNLADGKHPAWVGNFAGSGRAEILFNYVGDGNWWLGTLAVGQLAFAKVGNTVGFGDLADGGHPSWIGDFTGSGKAQILFNYVGDGNWWLGTLAGGQIGFTKVGNIVGFGDLADSGDLTHVPSGYLTNASHYGLTREAAAAVAGLASVAMTDDVDALAEALRAKSVEGTLARHTAEFACSLLAMAKAHERGSAARMPGAGSKWLAERMLLGAGRPGAERKTSLAERMPAYGRRATVDCALSAGWVCIAKLATVDPVRWRTICYALGFTEKQGQYLAFIYTYSHMFRRPRPRPICNAISASARPRSIRWS